MAMHRYFRLHPALGSKDRGEIAETIYRMVRWKRLLETLAPTLEQQLKLYRSGDWKKQQQNHDLPLPVRVSYPDELVTLLIEAFGVERAEALCLACNEPAPITVRVNRLKTTRDALLEKWKDLDVRPTSAASDGIIFPKRLNFFTLPEFAEGLFEAQDEGSQLVAELVKAEPGQWVLDYCSGSGGKTLAFAPKLNHRGQIFLYDIRKHILLEARQRLKRAGIQNAQFVTDQAPKLKKKMDWILVDAPCTGTGTYRRNPDMKEKFSLEILKSLVGQQRTIFERALSFLKPGGSIVYATCSILPQENEEQVAHFLKTYPLELVSPPFQSFPSTGGMDGLFGVVFKGLTH